MAIAAQVPNWGCPMPSQCPMTGNTKRATVLRMKIVASDSEVWFSSASITGATAAMALPPQIAVPDEIR